LEEAAQDAHGFATASVDVETRILLAGRRLPAFTVIGGPPSGAAGANTPSQSARWQTISRALYLPGACGCSATLAADCIHRRESRYGLKGIGKERIFACPQ
jgi:hypothetical protein